MSGLYSKKIFVSYLALVAALASEADYIFIPEDPASINWKKNICKKLVQVHNKQNSFQHL
jgi:6-phosphofructokinase